MVVIFTIPLISVSIPYLQSPEFLSHFYFSSTVTHYDLSLKPRLNVTCLNWDLVHPKTEQHWPPISYDPLRCPSFNPSIWFRTKWNFLKYKVDISNLNKRSLSLSFFFKVYYFNVFFLNTKSLITTSLWRKIIVFYRNRYFIWSSNCDNILLSNSFLYVLLYLYSFLRFEVSTFKVTFMSSIFVPKDQTMVDGGLGRWESCRRIDTNKREKKIE